MGMVGDILTTVTVMVMVTAMDILIMDMDITTLTIIIPITTTFHTIEEDETQIIIDRRIVEIQTFLLETRPIAGLRTRVA